jgi:hypothetical protein
MSALLSTITRGKRPRHIFALVYGTDGAGKSTMCSHAPNPVFIGAEKGTEQLDVARFPQTESISELLAQIRASKPRSTTLIPLFSTALTGSNP